MKKNFNVPVDESAAVEFEEWHESLPGSKGDKLTGALKAIQAIHRIDSGLAYKLMDGRVSIEYALDLIRDAVVEWAYRESLDKLSVSERSQLLLDAKQSKHKASRKV